MGIFSGKKSTNTHDTVATGAVIDSNAGLDQGFNNKYFDYDSQVNESYSKWMGKSTWGNSQVQTLNGLLTSFISSQGASISSPDELFKYWVESFFRFNRTGQGNIKNIVENANLAGKSTVQLIVKEYSNPKRKGVFVRRFNYDENQKYDIVLKDQETKDMNEGFYLVPGESYDPWWEEDAVYKLLEVVPTKRTVKSIDKTKKYYDSDKEHLHYLRFGKDRLNEEISDIGTILVECENYDRSLKSMRKLNHYGANISPVWKCHNKNEVAALKQDLKREGWTIGKGFIGTAELSYVSTKNNTAHEGIIKEIEQEAMRMTSQTGVPIHYMGFVQLMSNRSTADSLWDLVSTSTADKRQALADFMYSMLVDAQQMYIDNSIPFTYIDKDTKKQKTAKLTKVTTDFDISYPVVDYQNFLNLMKGLSISFNDGIINSDEYRKHMPEVDPVKNGPTFDVFSKSEEMNERAAQQGAEQTKETNPVITPENLQSKVHR